MNTTNLQLETIELTDNMQTSLLNKMNNNFSKIDEAYGTLKDGLLSKTGKQTISEAINYVGNLSNEINILNTEINTLNSIGNAKSSDIKNGLTALVQGKKITGTAFNTTTTATSGDIVSGKTAYDNNGNLITGTLITETIKKMPTINVELTGSNSTYVGYISGYGAGIDQNGNLVIWAMSSSTSYEHINFDNVSIGAGTINDGWNITSFNDSDPVNLPHACTIIGLSEYSTINVTLNVKAINGTKDYIKVEVTLTGS